MHSAVQANVDWVSLADWDLLAIAAAAGRASRMNVLPPRSANHLETASRAVSPLRPIATASAAADTDTVTLSSLARYAVKGDPAALDRLPASLRHSLSGVAADPGVSEPAKDLLFFNLVLRPASEARQGSAIAPSAAADRAAWAGYLDSLQSMNRQAMTIPGNDVSTLRELQGLYARMTSAL